MATEKYLDNNSGVFTKQSYKFKMGGFV